MLIYSGSKDTAVSLFNNSVSLLKRIRLNCTLSYLTDHDTAADKIANGDKHFDILMIDSSDEYAEEVAGVVRDRDYRPTVIFLAQKENIPDWLRFRPSAAITDAADAKATESALKFAFKEQMKLRDHFVVKSKQNVLRVKYTDIVYFESNKRVVTLHTATKAIEFYAKLSEVLDMLPPDDFIRCHQSYIVNMNKIDSLDKTNRYFNLEGDIPIEISKSNYQQVVQVYEAHLSRM